MVRVLAHVGMWLLPWLVMGAAMVLIGRRLRAATVPGREVSAQAV